MMEVTLKEIKEDGSQYLIYLIGDCGSPLSCEFATLDNKDALITNLKGKHEITNVIEMNYNEYIKQ